MKEMNSSVDMSSSKKGISIENRISSFVTSFNSESMESWLQENKQRTTNKKRKSLDIILFKTKQFKSLQKVLFAFELIFEKDKIITLYFFNILFGKHKSG